MSLKTISLSILVLSLVACDKGTPPPTATPAQPNTNQEGNAVDKAKGVESTVDKKAEDTKKDSNPAEPATPAPAQPVAPENTEKKPQ